MEWRRGHVSWRRRGGEEAWVWCFYLQVAQRFYIVWKSVVLWCVGCNQRFFSFLFEHVKCRIADCCLFALRLGYEIKSLYLLLEIYVFVRGCLFLYQNTNFTCGHFVCKFVFCGFCGHLAKVFLELLYLCKYQRGSGSSSVVETNKKKGQICRKNELITQTKLYLSHFFIPVKQ